MSVGVVVYCAVAAGGWFKLILNEQKLGTYNVILYIVM